MKKFSKWLKKLTEIQIKLLDRNKLIIFMKIEDNLVLIN